MPKVKAKKVKSKAQPLVRKANFYGFKHSEVYKRFGGELTYCNDITVNNEYNPVAVYRASKPDAKKGHKRYMLLQLTSETGLVRGMTEAEIAPYRKVPAVHCLVCDKVFHSVYRHDFTTCGCKNGAFIDGGRDYSRYGAKNPSKFMVVMLDIITNEVL